MNLGSYLLLCPQTQFQIIAAPKCYITELPYDLLLHAAGSSFIKDDTVSSIRSSKAQLRQAYYRMLWDNGGTAPSLICRVISSGHSWDYPLSPQALVPESGEDFIPSQM